MNTDIIVSYFPRYVDAFWLTVRIGAIGVGLAFVIGLVVAFLIHFKIPVLAQLAAVYVEFFRNTPLLVQLFFIYFGLPKLGFMVPAETCGALGLGLLGGSYMAEGFRSGLGAVSKSQSEGALALGRGTSTWYDQRSDVFLCYISGGICPQRTCNSCKCDLFT